ncbi:hypothetical protein OG21DRAFT_1490377 [Imleria badia]|nr:hypothetical protein OG21DRAFT_1490377 [Imleria badia]
MTGPGPDERNSVVAHDSFSGPVNHSAASNTSIETRLPQYQSKPPANVSHDVFTIIRTSGTVLAKAKVAPGSNLGTVSHARKRQKLDTSIYSTIPSNGASPLYASGPAPRSSVSESDVQMIEPPRATNNRSHSVPNGAEIIDPGVSSDDLGERDSHAAKSSSPDPLLSSLNGSHIFATHPAEYSSSASNKGKSRAKGLPERVESWEDDASIEEFTPPPCKAPPYSAKKSQEIPMNMVLRRREFWEISRASTPAASHQPVEMVVNPVYLTTGAVISRMKKRDEVHFAIEKVQVYPIVLELHRPTLRARKKRLQLCHSRPGV